MSGSTNMGRSASLELWEEFNFAPDFCLFCFCCQTSLFSP